MWFVLFDLPWEGTVVDEYNNKEEAIQEYNKLVKEKTETNYFGIKMIEGKVILKEKD